MVLSNNSRYFDNRAHYGLGRSYKINPFLDGIDAKIDEKVQRGIGGYSVDTQVIFGGIGGGNTFDTRITTDDIQRLFDSKFTKNVYELILEELYHVLKNYTLFHGASKTQFQKFQGRVRDLLNNPSVRVVRTNKFNVKGNWERTLEHLLPELKLPYIRRGVNNGEINRNDAIFLGLSSYEGAKIVTCDRRMIKVAFEATLNFYDIDKDEEKRPPMVRPPQLVLKT